MDIPLKTYRGYTTEKKCTLKSIQDCAVLPLSRPARHKTSQFSKQSLTLLRIGDVLVPHRVHEVIHIDKLANCYSAHSISITNTNMNQLLLFIHESSSHLSYVGEVDPSAFGKNEWTLLMGSALLRS